MRVLTAFGRAYGELPEPPAALTKEQQQFIEQAVDSLAEQEKVICVRLSLFAEMAKSRPWTPASLRQLGGAEGVGAAFLRETFSSPTAPPHHRYHERAARSLLKALLPEIGTDIKIARRSTTELLECTDYARRPADFQELIKLLDGELRLITPADVPDSDRNREAGSDASYSDNKQYQLTHDYLVPSLRQWLVGKQRETHRGRAELRLAEMTAFWSTRPERRRLPNLLEFLDVSLFTRRRDRTAAQQQMLTAAGRYHGTRVAIATLLLIAAALVGTEWRGRSRARQLVGQLMTADVQKVPAIIPQMQPYRRWVDPLLYSAVREAEANRNVDSHLNLSLALLPIDATQLDWLTNHVLDAPPDDVDAIRHAIWFRPERNAVVASMKQHMKNIEAADSSQGRSSQQRAASRLPAASLIALYEPTSLESPALSDSLINELLMTALADRKRWIELLRPAGAAMTNAAERAASNPELSPQERIQAGIVLESFRNGP
jgi:hypothetical protein